MWSGFWQGYSFLEKLFSVLTIDTVVLWTISSHNLMGFEIKFSNPTWLYDVKKGLDELNNLSGS